MDATVPTLWQWVREVLAELFGVDGKLPLTLRRLLKHPGALSKDWMEGRRVRYLHPFRLYFALAAAYFLVADQALQGATGLRAMADAWAESSGPEAAQTLGDFVAKWWRLVLLVILVPSLAAVLRLLVARKRRIVEHLVFSLCFHAALLALMLLILPVVVLPVDIDLSVLQAVPYLVAPVWLFLALRRHYGFRVASATGATVLLVGTSLATSVVVIALLMALGMKMSGAT